VLVACNMVAPLIILSIMLYVIGLLAKAYADTPLGIHVEFNTRNGPFFGLIFFVSGYMLSRRQPKETWFARGLVLLLAGYILLFSELLFLHHHFGTSMRQDFLIGTYGIGVGSSLMALSNVSFLRSRTLGSIGPLVLGIYAVHSVFVDLLGPSVDKSTGSPLLDLGYVLAVFTLSLGVVYAMSRTRLTRTIVA